MVCKKCGQDIPQDASTCPNCGEEVVQLEQLEDVRNEVTDGQQDINEEEPIVQEKEGTSENNETNIKDSTEIDSEPRHDQIVENDSQNTYGAENELEPAAVKKNHKKLWTGIGIGVVAIVIAALLFLNSEFFAFAVIKSNPFKAYSKAVNKQNDLKKFSADVNLSMDVFSAVSEGKISIDLNSKQDRTNNLSDTNMKMSTEQGGKNVGLSIQMYQKKHDYYIKVPNDKRYIVVKNYDKNINSSITKELANKFIAIMKENVSKKNVAAVNSSIKIDGKKINVIKEKFKISNIQAKNIVKEIMKSIFVTSYIQNSMISGNPNVDSQSAEKNLDQQLSSSLAMLNVQNTTYSAYIDKNGYIRKSEFYTEVQDLTNASNKFILTSDNVLNTVKDDTNVVVPSGVEKNSINSEDIKKNPDKYKDIKEKLSKVSGSSK